jgi:deoxycytidine triphosphate deaminase
MIEPFEDRQVRQGVVSYGVSSYGYDCRVGNEFKVFTNVYNTVVDPKNFDPGVLPHPARRADGVPRQVHLRPLRHHRQRHAVRA